MDMPQPDDQNVRYEVILRPQILNVKDKHVGRASHSAHPILNKEISLPTLVIPVYKNEESIQDLPKAVTGLKCS